MTNDEAEALLKQLSEHYHVPVMPITRYCENLRIWQRVLVDRVVRLQEKLYPNLTGKLDDLKAEAERKRYNAEVHRREPIADDDRTCEVALLRAFISDSETVNRTFTLIGKSCLLDRLLYCGEPLRTKMCPEHQGRWLGIDWDGSACAHGCGLTGWLPEHSGIVVKGA